MSHCSVDLFLHFIFHEHLDLLYSKECMCTIFALCWKDCVHTDEEKKLTKKTRKFMFIVHIQYLLTRMKSFVVADLA